MRQVLNYLIDEMDFFLAFLILEKVVLHLVQN